MRVFAFLMCLAIAACTRPADPAPAAARPPVSGIDPASIDRTVRPQDDLFHHVNGGAWLAGTEIPADKASYGAFDILFDKAQAGRLRC